MKPIQKKLSRRTQALLSHPQGMGNYFTFKSAIDILGLDWNDVAPGGVYAVTGKGYFDMGYMANHIGAPDSALKALREASSDPDIVKVYPPDCMPALKTLVAEHKFSRKLGADFEVLGVEGAQGGIGYTYLTFLDPGDEVIVTDPGYFHETPASVDLLSLMLQVTVEGALIGDQSLDMVGQEAQLSDQRAGSVAEELANFDFDRGHEAVALRVATQSSSKQLDLTAKQVDRRDTLANQVPANGKA